MQERFYVYLIEDYDGTPKYVGKGSGNRVKAQRSRFGGLASILSRHKRECDAFAEEIRQIAILKPYRNKHGGGLGGQAKRIQPYRKSAIELLLHRLGTREYARRLLLACGPSHIGVENYESLKNMGMIQCHS